VIRVRVHGASFSDGRARLSGGSFLLTAEGHALFAPKGNDIVCAGVSILVQSLARALVSHGIALEISTGDSGIKIGFDADDSGKPGDDFIAGSISMTLHGLAMMAESYPDHVDIEFDQTR
jgi:uncharacterized protein YsxB (DUF464 family)